MTNRLVEVVTPHIVRTVVFELDEDPIDEPAQRQVQRSTAPIEDQHELPVITAQLVLQRIQCAKVSV